MNALDKLRISIDAIEPRDFYKYGALFLITVLLLISIAAYYYYHRIDDLSLTIETINEEREKVSKILATQQRVKKQQAAVATELAKDDEFILGGYLNDVLDELKLSSHRTFGPDTTRIPLEDNYQEIVVKQTLVGLDMKQVCELLARLDKTKRIYTKELEITKSKRSSRAVDVILTIATLEPKTTATE